VFDRDSGKTVPAKLRAAAGNKIVEVEGQSIVARLEKIIEDAKVEVEHLSSRVLGVAEAEIRRDWVKESALSDVMTDELRGLSGADVALLNTGGLRSNIQAGEFRYSDLFMVFPFNNRGVIIKDMPVDRLLSLLKKSATTCGAYGALMQSGLKVRFERSCGVARAIDPHARLLRVETLTGEVLLDVEQGISPDPARRLSVATVDFLATGSSDYNDFAGLTVTADMGNLREIIANSYLAKPAKLSAAALDGRWLETAPDQPGVQK
jgi:2',3'-cyclic-nucleotide 2'-phosphodiesterase (5'-nucleotidase family)